MIVVFGGEKGGTGKSTIATNMAAMLAMSGKDTLLLDTDRQGTASAWAAVREEENISPRVASVQKFGKGLPGQVRDLSARYAEIIIDAGGRDSTELRYALGVADRVYIPIQPYQFDIWTLQQMDALVELAVGLNPDLQAYVVLNRVATNPSVREDRETLEFLAEAEFQHLKPIASPIRDRIAFRKAAREGLSVVEWGQDEKAASEIKALFHEVYG